MIPAEKKLKAGTITAEMQIAKDLMPLGFAIVSDNRSFSQESGHLASLRLSMSKGFREVWLVPTKAAHAHVAAKLAKPKLTMKEFNNTMRHHWSPEDMKAFIASQGENAAISFQHSTMGPQDCLYLPPAWSFSEQIGKQDFVGIKYSFLSVDHLVDLEEINKVLISNAIPNEILQRAVDLLTLAS